MRLVRCLSPEAALAMQMQGRHEVEREPAVEPFPESNHAHGHRERGACHPAAVGTEPDTGAAERAGG